MKFLILFLIECIGFESTDTPDHYYCDRCIQLTETPELLPTRATLIVCPAPILHQWKQEIEKHVNPETPIKLFVYEGVKKMILPYELIDYDVIMTTYDVLRSDLFHVEEDSKKYKLRLEKKYKKIPTPLTSLLWWRVCLDECQMVISNY